MSRALKIGKHVCIEKSQMKHTAYILFLLFTCSFSSAAQATPEEKMVLKEALNIVRYRTPVVYTKSIRTQTKESRQRIIEKIEKGKFYEAVPYNDSFSIDPVTGETTEYVRYVDSLILTSKEKQHLITDFGKSVRWEKGLFEHSIRVNDHKTGYKTIAVIKENPEKDQPGTFYYIFSFSRPVFIRDGTICLIAVGAICGGDCGIVNISFYRKTHGRWKRWVSVAGGEF